MPAADTTIVDAIRMLIESSDLQAAKMLELLTKIEENTRAKKDK